MRLCVALLRGNDVRPTFGGYYAVRNNTRTAAARIIRPIRQQQNGTRTSIAIRVIACWCARRGFMTISDANIYYVHGITHRTILCVRL